MNYFPFDHIHRYFEEPNLIFLLTATAIMKPDHLRIVLHINFVSHNIADFGRIPRLSSASSPPGLGEAEVLLWGTACF